MLYYYDYCKYMITYFNKEMYMKFKENIYIEEILKKTKKSQCEVNIIIKNFME